MKHIMKCTVCGSYTMKPFCTCGGKTLQPIPPKYSPVDKFAGYRRKAKRAMLEEQGVL